MSTLLFRILLALAAALAAFLIVTHPAEPAPVCAPRSQLTKALKTKYNETRVAIGLVATRRVMELFASPTTGSWTLAMTELNGVSCIIAAGHGFETQPLVEPQDPET